MVKKLKQPESLRSGPKTAFPRKADARSEGVTKVRAHPIIGWKGFEDVVNSIPGETVDIVRSSGTGEVAVGPAAALTGMYSKIMIFSHGIVTIFSSSSNC